MRPNNATQGRARSLNKMSHIAEGDFVVDHDERLAEVNAHGPCKTQLDQTTRHDRVSPQLLEHEDR